MIKTGLSGAYQLHQDLLPSIHLVIIIKSPYLAELIK